MAEVIEVGEDVPDDELMEEEAVVPTPDENADKNQEGYYFVEEILKHKFRQGWRFLTKWENFPVSASTWEPPRSFVLPDGRVCQPFKEYCQAKGLNGILKQLKAQE